MRSLMFVTALSLAPLVNAYADEPRTEPTDGMIKVAVVLSPHATMIDFAGPWEVFQDTMLEDSHGNHVMPFDLYTVAPSKTALHTSGSGHDGMTVTPDYSFADAPTPDIVVIGAQAGGAGLSEWLRKIHGERKLIMSVCTGAFKLAGAGLLDGKEATTHHWYFGNFSRDFPQVKLVQQVRYVQADPMTFTAGGLTSGIDLALHVVAERFGEAQAQKTADYMEYEGTGWKANQVATAFPTPVSGDDWSGEYAPGSVFALHMLTRGASTTFTVDIPAQKITAAPATVKSDESKISVAVAIDGHPATFEGHADSVHATKVTGTFTQDGKSRPLTLTKQTVTKN